MRSNHGTKRIFAVLLAALMALSLIPAQALAADGGQAEGSNKVGTGVVSDGGVKGEKLPEGGEASRIISNNDSQTLMFAPDANGAYYGDYVIIYNPDYSDNAGKSTGNLSGLIETSVIEHLDSPKGEAGTARPHWDEECQFCGTPSLLEETRGTVRAEEAPEGERVSYSVGSTRDFTLQKSPVSNNTVNFTCLAVGTHCYVWTPTDKTTQNLYPLDSIDSGYAKTYADEFDAKFSTMQSSFGDHWNGTSGDGKVHLVFYNISESSWNGFFSSGDFDDNGVPMINIDTYPSILTAAGSVNPASKMFNVIVHEYQHLIHYSICHAKNKSTESWLQEMMSAAAEEICYPGSSVTGRIPNWLGIWANLYPYTDPYYEARNGLYYGTSGALRLYGWSATSGLDSVSQYGKVSLYAQFLYTHLGGNTVYKTILNEFATHSDYTSGDAIDAVVRSKGADYSYNTQVFNRAFWIALTMNPGEGLSLTPNAYQYYGFKMQEGYDPASYYGVSNPYDLLCPLIYTGTGRTINGGAALVVKTKNGRFVPPSNANSGLQYVGVFTNEKLHRETVAGDAYVRIYNWQGYPFFSDDGAAKSTNAGVANSASRVAYATTEYFPKVKFRCKVSGEGSGSNLYDGLKVYYNEMDDDHLLLALASTNGEWQEYELSIPYEKSYIWLWFEYVKDGSVNNGDDCARIDDVEFLLPPDPTLDEALNYPGGTLSFTTGSDYPWYVDYVQSDDVGVSGNSHANDTYSYVTCRVLMYSGDELEFEYFYDTEENYDWFDFTVNGQTRLHKSGSGAWTTYTFTAYTTGIFTFEWRYTKDGSNHSGQDCVKLDNIDYISSAEQTYNVDYSLNVSGGDLHFTTDSWPTFSGDYWYDDTIVTAYNLNKANSYAEITTTVTMYVGDELRFEYYVSSEEDYDLFEFTVNDQTLMCLSGNLGWRYYSFTAPSTGYYTFKWSYSKDGSVDRYMDTVKLDNVEHFKIMPSLDTALNAENTDVWLHFVSTGTYPFYVNRDNPYSLYAESSNGNVDSSYSFMTSSVALKAGDSVSFYYFLSSEENYDWFDFYVDGTRVIHESGEPGIQYFTYKVSSSGVHTFEWRYTKDSSRSEGNDSVRLFDVRVISSSVLLGDVNLDGKVEPIDALLALRFAMGIISLSADSQTAADVDLDGNVKPLDALLILRYAMGIITSF